MEEPISRDAILDRITFAHAALETAIAALAEEEMTLPMHEGGWSVKDVLAHVATEERWFGHQLEAALDGRVPTAEECYGAHEPPPADFDLASQDARNAWHHSRNSSLSLEEVEDRSAEAHAHLIRVLERVTDADLHRPYTVADNGYTGHVRPAGEGERSWPLTVWIAGATWRHYEEHASEITAFADRLHEPAEE